MAAPSEQQVQTGTGPETIRALRRALVGGLLPDTYVSGGALVHMETVPGASVNPAADEDCPLPVSASPVTPAVLAGLLAEHVYVYRLRARRSENGSGVVESWQWSSQRYPTVGWAAVDPGSGVADVRCCDTKSHVVSELVREVRRMSRT